MVKLTSLHLCQESSPLKTGSQSHSNQECIKVEDNLRQIQEEVISILVIRIEIYAMEKTGYMINIEVII